MGGTGKGVSSAYLRGQVGTGSVQVANRRNLGTLYGKERGLTGVWKGVGPAIMAVAKAHASG